MKSPRTLAACKIIGVMPFQLKRIPLKVLMKHSSTPEIAQVRFDYQEKKRLELVEHVLETRASIIDNNHQVTEVCESCNLPMQTTNMSSFQFLPKGALLKRRSMESFGKNKSSIKDLRTQSSNSNRLSSNTTSVCSK